MSRNLPQGVEGAIFSDSSAVTFLIEINFNNGSTEETEYLSISPNNIVTNGVESVPDATWTGVGLPGGGSTLGIGTVNESTETKQSGVDLSFDAVDRSITSLVYTNFFRGRKVRIWKVWLDQDTGGIVGGLLMFSGYQNEDYRVSETWEGDIPTASISTTVVSRLAAFTSTRPVYTNLNSHQTMLSRSGLPPTDTGFSTVSSLHNRMIYWGTENPSGINQGGGAGMHDDDETLR